MLQIFKQSWVDVKTDSDPQFQMPEDFFVSSGRFVIFYRPDEDPDQKYINEENKILDYLVMDINTKNIKQKWTRYPVKIKLSNPEELKEYLKKTDFDKDLQDLNSFKNSEFITIVFENRIIQLASQFNRGRCFESYLCSVRNILWRWNEEGKEPSSLKKLAQTTNFSDVLCNGLADQTSNFHRFLTRGTEGAEKLYDPRITLYIGQYL